MMRFVSAVILFAGLAGVAASDTLERTSGAPVEGFFLSYDRGKINFMNREQKTLHESPGGVKKLILDRPLKGSLELKSKRGAKDDVTLTGFEQGSFLVERDGKLEKISVINLAEFRVDATANQRTMDQLDERAEVISKGGEVDLSKSVEQGRVTVVHFHLPGAITSERQGNYVETLVRDSKGKVALKRVVVEGANVPVARQHGLVTLPQFWFYGRDGQLVTKLTSRFTENDLSEALKKAAK